MSKEYPCVYFDNMKCKKLSEDGYTDWCVLGPCSHEMPSNADRIRAMSDEELAKWLADVGPKHCDRNCPAYDVCEGATSKMGCSDYIEKWLKQPYKEDA